VKKSTRLKALKSAKVPRVASGEDRVCHIK